MTNEMNVQIDLDPREDLDSKPRRVAKALLVYAHAIVEAESPAQRTVMLRVAAQANGTTADAIGVEISKFVAEIRFFYETNASTRWNSQRFRTLLDSSFCVECEPVSLDLKNAVREEIKCSLCNQYEHRCDIVVHLFGNKDFSAKSAFGSSDVQKLAEGYESYAETYNKSIDQQEQGRDEPFLGSILPGETCLKRLLAAFSSQDFFRSVIDDVSSFDGKDTFCFPYEKFSDERVDALASRIQHQFDVVSSKRLPELKEGERVFVDGVLVNFGKNYDDEVDALRAGCARINDF